MNNPEGNNNVTIGYQSGFNEINSDRLYIENSNAGQNGANLTTNQALATTGWQKITFNNIYLNPTMSTEFDTANKRFTAATTGIYRIDASFHTVNSQTNTQYYGIAVYINGNYIKNIL